VNGVAWKSVFSTIARLSYAFAEVFVALGFTYAQLGVFLYGGAIPKAGVNPALDNSPFGWNNFYIFSFNDMIASFFTLFACLRTSDWDVMSQGIVTTTGYQHNRVFFGIWYLIGVLLMLNILKSYFVVVFRSSRTKDGNEADEMMDANDDGDDSYIDKETAMARLYGGKRGIKTEDELEEEGEWLEEMNTNGRFIIDLTQMVQRSDFISIDGDKENFLDAMEQSRIALLNFTRDEIAKNDDPDNKARHSKDLSESYINTMQDRAIELNKFRFIIRFPFKQGMNNSERLPILRRMYDLSMKEKEIHNINNNVHP